MSLDPLAARAFVAANTRLLAPPLVPELALHLAAESLPIWEKTEAELDQIGLPPPFWAFAWAGGQALARYVLDHPEVVAGRRVLDFGAGSGLVALAAAKVGAADVTACELDAFAIGAMEANAAANELSITPLLADLVGTDTGWDVVLAADVAYERDPSARIFAWLEQLSVRGAEVLIGDPGRTYLPRDKLVRLETYEVPVTRDLEDAEIKRTSVWRFALT